MPSISNMSLDLSIYLDRGVLIPKRYSSKPICCFRRDRASGKLTMRRQLYFLLLEAYFRKGHGEKGC